MSMFLPISGKDKELLWEVKRRLIFVIARRCRFVYYCHKCFLLGEDLTPLYHKFTDMKDIKKTSQERWEENKERCKEVMSTTIAELTGREDEMARNLCSEMAEKGIMDFEGVAASIEPDGTVNMAHPAIHRIADFLIQKGFKKTEAEAIVTAVSEFAAATLIME